jgi:acetylornithine deacetylase/succinyl-diaminopimelate desuccinylase-like protein
MRDFKKYLVTAGLAALLSACSTTGDVSQPAEEAPTAAAEIAAIHEIEALMANPDVQALLAHIETMTPELREDLIELNEIPAPPFEEEDRAVHFGQMLLQAGLTHVHHDDEGNVLGWRPGRNSERKVAYTAHLDTVFPAGTDVTVRVDGDTLYAPGIGDNTRGLVVLLGVLRALQYGDIETDADIYFVGNVGEEGLGDLRGVKHLFGTDGPGIDSMIAVDGGNASRLVYGGVGSHRYRVTFKGPGGHSWGAFGRASPHHALGRAIDEFVRNAPAVTASGPKTSFNVGRIGGGTSVNSIAFESWMEIDLRSGDQAKLDAIDTVLQEAVMTALAEENAARKAGEELTVSIERIGTRPAALGDTEWPLLQRAMAAMRAMGVDPQLAISSTDANYPISIGIPAVTMSRGGKGANAHAPNESWQDIDSHVAIQIGLLTLLAEAGLAD